MKFEVTFNDNDDGRELSELFNLPLDSKAEFERTSTLDTEELVTSIGLLCDLSDEDAERIVEAVDDGGLFSDGVSFKITETENDEDEAVLSILSNPDCLSYDEAEEICALLDDADTDEEVIPAFLIAVGSYASTSDAISAARSRNYRSDLSLHKFTAKNEEDALTEYAKEYTESTQEIPDFLESYIDYKKMGHDLSYDLNVVEYGGYYWVARDV